MEIIILIGHGSPSKEAGDIDGTVQSLHRMMHPDCGGNCVRAAYLQFNKPSITEAIDKAAKDGAERIIIHPYFLSGGVHVTKSIPAIINEAKASHPDVKFIYTEPLGPHDKLAEIILERVEAAKKISG